MKIRSTSGSPRPPRKSGSTSNSDQIGNFECRCNLVADAVRTDVKVIVRENDYLTLALGKTSIVALRSDLASGIKMNSCDESARARSYSDRIAFCFSGSMLHTMTEKVGMAWSKLAGAARWLIKVSRASL